ncbi:MAG: sigma-70 family RNA polymerase sigma factor [Deltaproteobacteria bacterium]|nr:sigma-70 family RNA polymerase sigma factor [Deltaproteobacteria bacterium]
MGTALPVLNDSLGAYLAEINRYPLLSRDEEYGLAVRLRKHGDIDAAEKLVTANLRFVVKIALEYRDYGVNLKDLIQEGNIGLMHAVKKFDPEKGVRLISYAVWWIRSFIQEHIVKAKGLVSRATRAAKKALFYKNENSEAALPDVSLDAPILSGRTATHLDMLADTSPGQEELMAEGQLNDANTVMATKALAVLNPNERFVIEHRIMAETEKSLQEIGDSLGISRERVRQIEAAAMKKLKKAITKN